MASDFSKPDKIHTLYESEIVTKMWPLPVEELFMLGKRTAPKLYNMGIKTIGELAKTDIKFLIHKFGKQGKMLWEYANGIDNSEVNYIEEKPKGIGNSITLPKDICSLEELEDVFLILVEKVTYRLRFQKMIANTVDIQLRTNKFEIKSHQGKLEYATANTKMIYERAKELLKESYKKGEMIRLVGVRVDGLIDEEEKQISFFETKTSEKREKLDKTLDMLKNKYGYDKISCATKLKVEKK